MSQARLNIHAKFGGNPFASHGEKCGQTNQLFSNFSMMILHWIMGWYLMLLKFEMIHRNWTFFAIKKGY